MLKVLRIIARVLFPLAYFLIMLGAVLHTVFEKSAMVAPSESYWLYLTAALALIVGLSAEIVWHYRNSTLKYGLLKAVPSLLCLPLIYFRLADPYYVYINLSVLLVFVAAIIRLAVSGLFAENLVRTIVPLVISALVLTGTIISFVSHASFEQMDWDIPAAITALVSTVGMFFTFQRHERHILNYIRKH